MFDQTKAEILKAKENVKKQSLLKKKKLLSEFIEKTKISICLTSPKTREGEIAMKSNSVKNLGPDKEKIWL
jgi:guanylate kinase